MRAEGALRLILNTALFPHTITKRVQEKGIQVRPPLYRVAMVMVMVVMVLVRMK